MSLSDPRKVIEGVFVRDADPDRLDFRGECLDALDRGREAFFETTFSSLPRRFGRELMSESLLAVGEGKVDLAAWRACDLLAAELLLSVEDGSGFLRTLWSRGDGEERRMLARSFPFRDPGDDLLWCLAEAHRSNDESVFESAFLDSDLASRVLPEDLFNRVVLKMAFLGLPPSRLLGWEARVNDDLVLMLFDFRLEREAAGRPVWEGTSPMMRGRLGALRGRKAREQDPDICRRLGEVLAELEAS